MKLKNLTYRLTKSIRDRNSFSDRTPEAKLIEEIRDGRCLSDIPIRRRSYAVCYYAGSQHSWQLQYVPYRLRDRAICRLAIEDAGWQLEYVPKKPKELKSYDLCMTAVKNSGYALEFVPTRHLDYAMCKAAVLQHRDALQYVPEDLPGRELLVMLATRPFNE
jgi:hypothetical protein